MWPFASKTKPQPAAPVVEEQPPRDNMARSGFFSSDLPVKMPSRAAIIKWAESNNFKVTPDSWTFQDADGNAVAMDSDIDINTIKGAYRLGYAGVPDAQLMWYASQSFIGFQTCGILAQHWLVDKACSMPAKDAIRNGYNIIRDDGKDLPADVLAFMKKCDKRMNLNRTMYNFIRKGRIFGIRIALFQIDGVDYSQPFNPDGITPGSYKGIVQVDPYWILPELAVTTASDPMSKHYYEPEFWNCNGKRYHRSHFVIFRTEEVVDVLKPTYVYAGVSIPQKIYERVYASERTANEAPQLAMTKRLTVLGLDLDKAIAAGKTFIDKMTEWAFFRDNFGIKVKGADDTVEQFDTSLADLDAVIMTQYQIVAAAANVPSTKLLGTTPKGFNATGEYEEASYHEELESIQTHDLTPLLERHHLCLIKSAVVERFPEMKNLSTEVAWRPLDAPTSKEIAEVNLLKAQAGVALTQSGAIDGTDERDRLINDPDSGYTGLQADPELEDPADATATKVADVAANQNITNLTGKQFQNLERILRKVKKQVLTEAQGVQMLQQAFGMTDQQARDFITTELETEEPIE